MIENSVPRFVEDGRRLGGLMMGPHIQSGRISFSLAQSWKMIAQRAQNDLKHRQHEWKNETTTSNNAN